MQIDFVGRLKGDSVEMGSSEDPWVPVYLPDRTVIGKAKSLGDGMVEIHFDDYKEGMDALFKESLVGLSIFAREPLIKQLPNEEKEGEKDG
jgi:hypothetical protein